MRNQAKDDERARRPPKVALLSQSASPTAATAGSPVAAHRLTHGGWPLLNAPVIIGSATLTLSATNRTLQQRPLSDRLQPVWMRFVQVSETPAPCNDLATAPRGVCLRKLKA